MTVKCRTCSYEIIKINGKWQHDAVERYKRDWKPNPHEVVMPKPKPKEWHGPQ